VLRQGVNGYHEVSFKEKCRATPAKVASPCQGEAICKIPERNVFWAFLRRTFVMARKGKTDRRGRKWEAAERESRKFYGNRLPKLQGRIGKITQRPGAAEIVKGQDSADYYRVY
jgi:hypothetical protein